MVDVIEGETDEETVQLMMETLHVDETTARFIIALERGEIDGDIVTVDDGQANA